MDDLERQLLTTWSELARRQAEADQRAREAHAPPTQSIPAEARHAAERAARRRLRDELIAQVRQPLHRDLLPADELIAVWTAARHQRGAHADDAHQLRLGIPRPKRSRPWRQP